MIHHRRSHIIIHRHSLTRQQTTRVSRSFLSNNLWISIKHERLEKLVQHSQSLQCSFLLSTFLGSVFKGMKVSILGYLCLLSWTVEVIKPNPKRLLQYILPVNHHIVFRKTNDYQFDAKGLLASPVSLFFSDAKDPVREIFSKCVTCLSLAQKLHGFCSFRSMTSALLPHSLK